MITNKPTILIYTAKPDMNLLKEICAGIEEEGVLLQVVLQEDMDIDCLSFEAANDSILGAGIGISHIKIALSLRLHPKEKPIFKLENPTIIQARNLGINAARVVKRMPLKDI
jgi:hypothetical protein